MEVLDGLLAVSLIVALAVWFSARRGLRRARRDPRLVRAMRLARAGATLPGPRREAARLRLSLHDGLASTRHAVDALAVSGAPAGDLPALARRLDRAAQPVDGRLSALEREPDPAVAAALLPAAAERTRELLALAGRLRTGAAEQLEAHGGLVGGDLATEIDDELAALRAGRGIFRQPSR